MLIRPVARSSNLLDQRRSATAAMGFYPTDREAKQRTPAEIAAAPVQLGERWIRTKNRGVSSIRAA